MVKECKALKLEKEAMHQGMWESLKAEKKGEKESFLEPQEKSTTLCIHINFSPQRPMLISNLQNCKIINLCCFKPLNFWSFGIAAIGN